MASKIFQHILDRSISQFVGRYSEDSSAIFKDEQDKLVHPGEYGKYREESCKELLRLILGKEVSISDGFIITSDDSISTQCDIIVYNAPISPLIADGIARMFPAEEVRMIGEVKSTLSKSALKEALRKMAANKQMIIEGRYGRGKPQYVGDDQHFNTVASFLICNKLDSVNIDELTYEEIYENIDRKYWHNSILVLEDGVLNYGLHFLKKSNDKKNREYVHRVWEYPLFYLDSSRVIKADKNFIRRSVDSKYHHIKCFLVEIATCNKNVLLYDYDPIVYLGLDGDPVDKP